LPKVAFPGRIIAEGNQRHAVGHATMRDTEPRLVLTGVAHAKRTPLVSTRYE